MKALRGLQFGEVVLLIWLGLWLAGLVGWCLNLWKLIAMCCEPTGWLWLRAIGVVALPLGAIVGFF